MNIKVRHSKFTRVELRDGSLVIHSMHGKTRTLQENILDVGVVVQGDIVRIVGFVNESYAWYFSGTDDLQSERIELGQPYGGGGRLIGVGSGNLHLLYFVRQLVGSGSLLRHQIFSDQWSVPQTVSTNVFGERSSYNASWHHDGYVHLVYSGHKDRHLLYRVYDQEQRMWSGAVIFSEERCSYPQFISTPEQLYLFWQEDKEKINLRVRHKKENWSPATQVSSGEGHCSSVGYSIMGDQWKVLWGEESNFYEAPFDRWSERKVAERSNYDYAWIAEDLGTIAVYEPKDEEPELPPEVVKEPAPEPLPEPTPEPTSEPTSPAEDKAQMKQKSEEAKLQAAFMEQAFRTLQQWEKVKEEIDRWQKQFKVPEPVDLNPLTTRVERLERRILSLQQGQEQSKKAWQDDFAQVEQGLTRTRKRLQELEDAEKNKPTSLFQRFLRRG